MPLPRLSYSFQKPDARDYQYSAAPHETSGGHLVQITKPKSGDALFRLRAGALPTAFNVTSAAAIVNQGDIGSCAANAAFYSCMCQTNGQVPLSRLMLYAVSRCLDNTPMNADDGTYIRTICQSVLKYGVCLESVFPYVTSAVGNFPPLAAFQKSKLFSKFEYFNVRQTLVSIQTWLVQNPTCPLLCGIVVYPGFMNNPKGGIIPMPNLKKETALGGHAVCIVGYDTGTKRFKCANSWGTSWGDKGYFYLPFDYVLNAQLCGDITGCRFAGF